MLMTIEDKRASTERRFTAKIKINKHTGCWVWQGAARNRSTSARGLLLNSMSGKVEDAAKVSIRLYRPEQDLKDKQVTHTCGDTLCVNPAHLKVVPFGMGYAIAEAHPNAKLDSATVRKLRRVHEYNRGRVSLREMAKRYGVSHETIRTIALGYDSVLPAEQVSEIRRLYKPRITTRSVLPKGMRVGSQAVNKAAAGGTWRNVDA